MKTIYLSQRQKEILDFIRNYTNEKHYPPSMREIGKAVNISTTSVVNYHLNVLAEAGYIGRDAATARGIWLTEQTRPGC